jgi:hypothetical protein
VTQKSVLNAIKLALLKLFGNLAVNIRKIIIFNLIVFYALANLLVGAFLYKKQERSRTMEALWFVLGFVVTTTVVLATEKLIIKN